MEKYFMKIKNILLSSLVFNNFLVMLNKVFLRFFDTKSSLTKEDLFIWLKKNENTITNFCSNLDKKLWTETKQEIEKILEISKENLKNIPYDLGGAAATDLIYFLTRYSNPKTVVETGVGAGFSSFSILQALKVNNVGKLYSSDFPYFRLPNPTRYVGAAVPNELKHQWKLYLDGDKINLNKISDSIGIIDLFHYDSDKSYNGRKLVLELITPKIHKDSWLIMDDIGDNSFFYDFVYSNNFNNGYKIFKIKNKWVGLIHPKLGKNI